MALYQNVFKRTCANSGCHDGSFEPDFRTVESSYNTLVYHPIIKNDPQGNFTHRVVPGNVEQSVLYIRLTEDIDGNSGTMPLEETEDWIANEDQHIQNIKTWIEEGAKDVNGNKAELPDKEPEMEGAVGYDGGNVLPRDVNGSIQVGNGNTVDIWFSFQDDNTNPKNFTNNQVKFSLSRDNFDDALVKNLQVPGNTKQAVGFNDSTVTFTHKVTFDAGNSKWYQGAIIFIRVYVQDNANDVTEIPEFGSMDHVKEYFSIRID